MSATLNVKITSATENNKTGRLEKIYDSVSRQEFYSKNIAMNLKRERIYFEEQYLSAKQLAVNMHKQDLYRINELTEIINKDNTKIKELKQELIGKYTIE